MASDGTANEELVKAAEGFLAAAKSYTGDQSAQMKLLKQADKLRLMIETPLDTLMKQWEMSNLFGALNILVEFGCLEKIPNDGTIKATELAELVGLEKSVIARALRMVVMSGIMVETEPGVFAHNNKSQAYKDGALGEYFRLNIDHMRAFITLPEYFKTHTQEDLFDLKKSPFAWGLGLEGMTYYEAISHDPNRFNMFNKSMALMEPSTPVLGMFPWASLKPLAEKEPERPLIVDIGGGRGHCLVSLQAEAPAGFGSKLILQDRPDVINSLSPEDIPNIEKMAYDFFEPQPVKNAHIYLLRRILHDFYEPVCIKILQNVAEAMGPDSRLIIAEMIMPERTQVGEDITIFWVDFSMMMLNGKEKTKEEYSEILDAVGLEIVKIWPFSFGQQSMLECRLKT